MPDNPNHEKDTPATNNHNEIKEKSRNLDMWALGISMLAFLVSLASTFYTREQVGVEKDIGRKQLRAWVLPEKMFLISPLKAGDPINIRFGWKNYGSTPALNVSVATWLAFGFVPEVPDTVPFEERTRTHTEFLGPNTPAVANVPIPIPDSLVRQVIDNETRLFIYEHIEYTDVFGDLDETNCFMEYLADGTFRMSEKNNSIK